MTLWATLSDDPMDKANNDRNLDGTYNPRLLGCSEMYKEAILYFSRAKFLSPQGLLILEITPSKTSSPPSNTPPQPPTQN